MDVKQKRHSTRLGSVSKKKHIGFIGPWPVISPISPEGMLYNILQLLTESTTRFFWHRKNTHLKFETIEMTQGELA